MSDDDLEILRVSIARMKSLCGVIRVVCLVCLIIFAAFWILFSCLEINQFLEESSSGVSVGDLMYLLLFGILVITLFVVTLKIFSDIKAGETPFSLKQVKRLRIVGTAFLAFALLDLLISSVYFFGPEIIGQYSGVILNSGIDSSFIHVNLAAVIAALACYGLSVIFKYGILLQELSDDTL